ncbi:MAG: DUF1641 domain-containing protein [FCB group bacterium]|nr:DUF1641 domain-containing protein [FCB group bacterium]
MEAIDLQQQLAQIQSQQALILEELAIARRHRREMEELKEDLTGIAKDVFQSAVVELEDVAPFVQTGDFLKLVKKIIRNVHNINEVIHKFESVLDFFEDGKPIGKDLFQDLLHNLDELDRKGYFDFVAELFRVADNVVTHFGVEDVKLLGENIVSILETVKNLSQPDMLHSINNAVSIYKDLDTQQIEDYTIWRALKELRTPEMKKGIGFIMTFLKNLSRYQNNVTQA